MTTTRTRRGRTAPKRKTNPAIYVYALIGLVIIAIAGLVYLGFNRSSSSATATASGTSSIDVASLGSFPSKGDANAPVTVVEFADYQCPGCAAYANSMAAQIDAKYVDTGKVRFIYHELPIPSHANAYVAAEAARAAGDQGKYWEMNKLLFARQNDWAVLPEAQAVAMFSQYAQELGLDTAAFSETLSSGKYEAIVKAAYDESIAANISSTPSFVINGKIYGSGELEKAIESALAGS